MPVLSTSISGPRRVRALTTTIAVGAVSALALAGCSSSGKTGGSSGGNSGGKSAAETLTAAVSNLNSGHAASFELSLKPDDAMIAAMSKSGNPQDIAIGKKLLGNGGIVLKVTASADKPLNQLKAGDNSNAEIDFKAGGTDFFDIRIVNGALYAKANVPQIVQLSGKPIDVNALLASGQVPDALKAPVQAAVDGKWIGVSAADLKSLQQLASSGGDLTATPTAPNSAALAGVSANLIKALTKDTTVTDQGGGKFEVKGQVKAVAQDVLAAVEPVLSNVPKASKSDLDKMKESLNNIPDSENVTFDVWVKNNTINELQIDLAQFIPATQSGGGHLPLDAKFSQNASPVGAPNDVTMLDLKSLMGAFAGL